MKKMPFGMIRVLLKAGENLTTLADFFSPYCRKTQL